ncbi:LysR family transcriptional regulator [Pseudooceanicola sp. CBS1P-1]|uniref:LysR family transcriptional regulator n=1 Tax=Pseudooceanicola albus TaxID=2692189 RepID=A0A6L7GCC1_9RHOB|nr:MULTISPECIES: LysR family transcriptional regulator [Pseudooceanicola]MBT9386379.1 LysR family transcriptional regulator [Pseudooceanicola endophyticus]MXN20463.1 LysR family transcriptional regulator [Pseudooceanicola albus]
MVDWLALPPLTALRALAALSETGSTVAAGARLNVSHAAVSQQVKLLEERLGLSLVDRSGRQLALSAEGRQIADAVIEGLSGVETVIARLTGQEAARPLTVSCTPAFAGAFLLPRLADFQKTHPGQSLMIDPTATLKEVGPGGVEVALRYGGGDWPGLEAELLILTPVAIVAAPGLVPGDGPVNPADLSGYPWLQELGTSEASDFLSWHGARLDLSQGVTSLPGNMVLDAARDGRGIAVIARAFAEADIAAGRLRLLYEDRRKKGYYLVTRPGHLRPVARDFIRWVRAQARG